MDEGEKGNLGYREAEALVERAELREVIDRLEKKLALGLVEGGGKVEKELGLAELKEGSMGTGKGGKVGGEVGGHVW